MSSLELDLRRLRFTDAGLEEAFREDFGERSRLYVRFSAGVMLLVISVLVATDAVRFPGSVAAPGFLFFYGSWIGGLLAACLLTFARSFGRFAQEAMTGLCLLMGISLTQYALPNEIGHEMVMLFAFGAYTAFRLRLVRATLVCWTIIGLYLVAASRFSHPEAPALDDRALSLLLANFTGMLAATMMEHSARRDFALSRLLEAERQKSEKLLLNILPRAVAERLKLQEKTIADDFPVTTVLFADIVDFTPMAARLAAPEVVDLLNRVFSAFDRLAEKHGLEKIKTIGDAYMVVGGLPEPRPDHASAVAEMALEMMEAVREFVRADGQPLALRIGIHSGPVVAGVIGETKFIYDLWGDTVNVASRMESHGVPAGIQVTERTRELLGEGYLFDDRGTVDLKGRGPVRTYLLKARRSSRSLRS